MCPETAAGEELASLSAAARRLPALASGGGHVYGPSWSPPLPQRCSQIESRFVSSAPALRRPRRRSATLIRGRHRANRISVIRGSVRAALLSLMSPKKTGPNMPPCPDSSSAAPSVEARRIKCGGRGDQSALFTAAVGPMSSRFLPD